MLYALKNLLRTRVHRLHQKVHESKKVQPDALETPPGAREGVASSQERSPFHPAEAGQEVLEMRVLGWGRGSHSSLFLVGVFRLVFMASTSEHFHLVRSLADRVPGRMEWQARA